MITAIIICITIVTVSILFLKYIKEIILNITDAYIKVHTPPTPIIHQVSPELLKEIHSMREDMDSMKSKISGVEMSKGIRRL